jgi:hypothetical protein
LKACDKSVLGAGHLHYGLSLFSGNFEERQYDCNCCLSFSLP